MNAVVTDTIEICVTHVVCFLCLQCQKISKLQKESLWGISSWCSLQYLCT